MTWDRPAYIRAAVRHFTDLAPNFVAAHVREHKLAIGPTFTGLDVFTGKCVARDSRIDYVAFHARTGIVFTYCYATRGEALESARAVINELGPEQLAWLFEHFEPTPEAQTTHLMQRLTGAAQKPRKVGKRARAVFEASEGRCHYCGTALTLDGRWHIEHKMPRALFGGSEQDNLAAACAPCNHAKRDKTDLEFIAERDLKA